MNGYYSENDGQAGPVAQPEFDALVQSGKISPDTQVWHDGMPAWTRYGDLAAAPSVRSISPAAGLTHRCAECGNTFPASEMIAFENASVCAACKPVFVQKLKEGVIPAGILNYAGFWVRVGAKFIDGIILQIVNFCLGLAIGAVMSGGSASTLSAQAVRFLIKSQT